MPVKPIPEEIQNEKECKKMSDLMNKVVENGVFILEFLVVVAVLFVVSYVGQKLGMQKRKATERILSAKMIAVVGLFSALSAIIMLFEVPMPFAPSFYKIDLSDVPALVGGFAMGPVAGVMIEFLKIVLKLMMKSTSTAFVGELANFVVGCSFIIPATIMYQFNKKKKTAIAGCVAGTLVMSIFGTAFNAIYLLPKFAELYGMPLEALVEMGTKINPQITDVTTFVIWAVFPLNIIKGILMSVVTMLIYKPISKEFHKLINS